jgi:F-type H+-transporting ATPase subunit b
MASFASLPLAAGGLTDLNPGLTLWAAITFLFLLVVLSKFAWGPIVKMLDERERTIREAIEAAKKERGGAHARRAEELARPRAA